MNNTLRLIALVTLLSTSFTDVNAGRELTPQEAEEISVLKEGTIVDREDNFVNYSWIDSDPETVVAKFIELLKDLDAENIVKFLKKLKDQGQHFPTSDKDHFGNAFKSLYMYEKGVVNPHGMKVLGELAQNFGSFLTKKARATAQLGNTPDEKKWFNYLAKKLTKLENQLMDAWSNTFAYEGPGFYDGDQGGAAAAADSNNDDDASLPSYHAATSNNDDD